MSETRYDHFQHDIDLTIPFGLKLRIEAETHGCESGAICLLPNTEGPPLHVHTAQDETFSVLEGTLFVRSASGGHALAAGQSLVIPKHEPHTYANRSPSLVVFRYVLSPGGDFTAMMRDFEGLARSGRVKRIGDLRTMVHIAATISKYEQHVRSVRPPQVVMRMLGGLSRFMP